MQDESHQSIRQRVWVTSMVDRYERSLLAYARSLLRGDSSLAEDVVQETFIQLWNQPWPEIEEKVEGWLFLVCRHRCLDSLRRWETRMHQSISIEQWHGQRDSQESDPAERCAQQDQIVRLRTMMNSLSDRQQQVLRLRLHQGMSYQQISDATGISVSSVGFQIHEALITLRSLLRE